MAGPRARTTRGPAIGLIVAATVALLPIAAQAVPGEPVPTFAGDGTLEVPYAARAVTTDAQGRILVASVPDGAAVTTLTLQRFTAAGAADTTFSGDGELSLAFTGRPLGDPVVFSTDGAVRLGLPTTTAYHAWSVGDGGVLDGAYGTSGLATVATLDAAPAMATLVAAVPAGAGLAVVWTEGAASTVTVLDASGHPKPSFGGDGSIDAPKLTKPVAARPSGGLLAQGPDGLIPIAADGALGTPVVPSATSWPAEVLVDAQDRVLVVSRIDTSAGAEPGTVLQRLTSSLQADATYGTTGSITLAGDDPSVRTVAGRRFVVSSTVGGTSATSQAVGYRGQVWVAALDAAGALDPSFGTAGVLAIDDAFSEGVLTYSRDRPTATLVPAPSGGLAIAVGHRWNEASIVHSQSRRTLRQYTASGALAATIVPTIAVGSMVDGGDDGSTFLAVHGQDPITAPNGWTSRLVRIELQQPDPPGAPGKPEVTAVDGAAFTVRWAASSGAPDRYVVSATEPGAATAAASASVPASQTSATIAVPKTGRPYRFDVYAVAGDADGPRSAVSGYTLAPFASAQAFAAQLAVDVPGWPKDPNQRAWLAMRFADHGSTEELLVSAANDPLHRSAVDPVTRLYTAYFDRLPDSGGLRHWVAKRRSGTTVARISAQFAASSEFRRTYGKLTDPAFVDLVYRNVLDRAPDPAGLEYWTGRLSSGRTSRGQLMASFSESDEHIRKLATPAYAVRSYLMLLGRAPRAAEVARWTAPNALAAVLMAEVIETPEYAARVG